MKRILVPSTGANDWKRLLAKPTHWQPNKSAMSAAASWESNPTTLPPEVSASLAASGDRALQNLKLLAAIPEWEVELPGGSTSSCTDIMAFASNGIGLVAIAVEAKVDETFGPTLGEKRQGASKGQTERLECLHRLLGLSTPLPDDIRYQPLHRTVSEILTARAFHAATAAMLVQSFSSEYLWWDDFDKFCRALGAECRRGSATRAPGVVNPQLFLGWCTGERRFREMDLSKPS